ncbi:bacteriophage antitermination protein Q, partial [Salmonella enterica]
CEYIWLRMHERLRSLGKRITDDMTGNLIKLTGITAWNAGQLISGKDNAEVFAATYAAQEIGVSAPAWSQSYKKHWEFLCDKCVELDRMALENLMKKN